MRNERVPISARPILIMPPGLSFRNGNTATLSIIFRIRPLSADRRRLTKARASAGFFLVAEGPRWWPFYRPRLGNPQAKITRAAAAIGYCTSLNWDRLSRAISSSFLRMHWLHSHQASSSPSPSSLARFTQSCAARRIAAWLGRSVLVTASPSARSSHLLVGWRVASTPWLPKIKMRCQGRREDIEKYPRGDGEKEHGYLIV